MPTKPTWTDEEQFWRTIRRALLEVSEPIIVKATIGNLKEYRYCMMKVAEGDDTQASLD